MIRFTTVRHCRMTNHRGRRRQADEDVLTAHAEPVVQFVGHVPEEGKLLLLGISDGAGHLYVDEVRRSLDVEKVRIENEILRCMLANDHEAVAIWCLQDLDNPLVHDVAHCGTILGRFSLSEIDACKRHKILLEWNPYSTRA